MSKSVKIIKKKRQKSRDIDPKKERILKHLAAILEDCGFVVRRERLKRGHGWRVLSGSCDTNGDSMVFVDRRLSQDDQINFLVTRIASTGHAPKEELLEDLPDNIQNALTGA